MTKPDILYYECLHYQEENLELLKNLFTVHTITDPRYEETFSQTMKDRIRCIFLPHGFKFGMHQLGKFPKLKIIASNTTTKPKVELSGMSATNVKKTHKIHILYLEDRVFLNNITCTAEHALGLMHSVHRQIPFANVFQANGEWDRYQWGAPKMLSNMNAVIWGLGRVGKHLVVRARPLFNTISTIEEANGEKFINGKLSHADVLFLTMSPVGTQPVVSHSKLDLLPQDAMVLKFVGGEVLNTDHLLRLLSEGRLGGAGLDVLPRDHAYQYGETDPIWEQTRKYQATHTNLIITPHIAGSTRDAWSMTQRYIIDRVKGILL